MLATFSIEILFAVYTLWRYKLTTITRLSISILGFLAVFQGAEFMLCGGMGVEPGTWSRISYGAITLLPPLGIHLAYTIAGKKADWVVGTAYATCVAFLAYFVGITDAISGHTCYANYAVFDIHAASAKLYGLYYYGWLIIGAFLCLNWTKHVGKAQRNALRALAIGYGALLIPTTAVNMIDPTTTAGIPSIMCGFAVILAFLLVGKVVPESTELKAETNKRWIKLPF